jgi:AraC family transcriptional regulator, exoenzyme S synthesis regulatory protein ExsA
MPDFSLPDDILSDPAEDPGDLVFHPYAAPMGSFSLSTFKRRFLKLYGEPPNQWILKRRMEIARDLLACGPEGPGEICHKVGYRNHSSFTQAFKQVFGMTPKEFRMRRMDVPR